MMDVLEILKTLVEIPSPSGKENEIIDYLMNLLAEMKYDPIVHEIGDVKNIILNPNAEVWIVTHLDTVPIKRKFEFDGVYAYGTGVCDTKGSIVAILLALNELDDLKFGVALLSDEEEGGKGSEILVKYFEPRKAIVMEPTSLKIANVHYGSLEIVAEFNGVPAHGSMPEFGKNAVDIAIDAICKIREAIKPPIEFSIQEIHGGNDEYVIPDHCYFRLDLVFPPEVSSSNVKSAVLRILNEFYAKVRIEEIADGFVSSDEVCSLLESAIENVGLNAEYGAMPSWTDAINLKSAGWDVVVFGPGELQFCHTERERIAIDEIVKAKDVLKALNGIL